VCLINNQQDKSSKALSPVCLFKQPSSAVEVQRASLTRVVFRKENQAPLFDVSFQGFQKCVKAKRLVLFLICACVPGARAPL
jgi:hypothetical protein